MYKKLHLLYIIVITCNIVLLAQSPYTVTNNSIVKKPVSSFLYSSFVELGWGRSTDNMWSELLYNRSFEEKEAKLGEYAGGQYVKDLNIQKENWWHSGYEAAKWYIKKDENDAQSHLELFDWNWPFPAHGKKCMKIFNKSKDKYAFLCQDSIYLHKNISYSFEGQLNNLKEFTSDSITKESVTITVCLFKEGDFSRPLAEKDIKVNTGYFKNYKATLPSFNYEGQGTFAIKVRPGEKVNVDLVSLIPDDNILGWRKDVIAAMKDSVPVGTIRFPGGCFASTYNWKDGIGDRQNRKMIFDALSDGGGDVVQDVGTIEFLNLCKLIHTQPILDVPVMLNSASNAADWVSFCNAQNDPLRKSLGYAKSFNVKYWEMDNEPYRKYDPISYAHKCVEFSKAMKKVDPSIKIIMGAYFTYGVKLKEMLDIAGAYIDVINKREDLPFTEYQKALGIIAQYNKIHHTSITMCDTETTFPMEGNSTVGVDGLNHDIETKDDESTTNKAVRWAHGMSCIKNYIKFQNLGGDFLFANLWAYVNSYGQNLINVSKEKTFVSSMGRAFQFLEKSNIAYPLQVKCEKENPNTLVQVGWNKAKDKIILIALNFNNESVAFDFDLSGLHIDTKKDGLSYCIYANDMKDFNSESQPFKIKTTTTNIQINDSKFQLNTNGNSATFWELHTMPK